MKLSVVDNCHGGEMVGDVGVYKISIEFHYYFVTQHFRNIVISYLDGSGVNMVIGNLSGQVLQCR